MNSAQEVYAEVLIKVRQPTPRITPLTPQGKAAKEIGISRITLWGYCRFYGLESSDLDEDQKQFFHLLYIYLKNAAGPNRTKVVFQTAVENGQLQQLFEDLLIFDKLQEINPNFPQFIKEIDTYGYNPQQRKTRLYS